jgi:hypothetical protein
MECHFPSQSSAVTPFNVVLRKRVMHLDGFVYARGLLSRPITGRDRNSSTPWTDPCNPPIIPLSESFSVDEGSWRTSLVTRAVLRALNILRPVTRTNLLVDAPLTRLLVCSARMPLREIRTLVRGGVLSKLPRSEAWANCKMESSDRIDGCLFIFYGGRSLP